MIEMAGSNGLMLLAGHTFGSFASENAGGTMQAAVVMLQSPGYTHSPTPAPVSGSESSLSDGIIAVSCIVPVAFVLFLAALGLWLRKRGASSCPFGKTAESRASVFAVSEPRARSVESGRGGYSTSTTSHGDGGAGASSTMVPVAESAETSRENKGPSSAAIHLAPGTGVGTTAAAGCEAEPAASALWDSAQSVSSCSVRSRGAPGEEKTAIGAANDDGVALPSRSETGFGTFGAREAKSSSGGKIDPGVKPSLRKSSSSGPTLAFPRGLAPASLSDDIENPPASLSEGGLPQLSSREKSSIGVAQAVLHSADQIARNSTFVGISEAATVVSVLVRLIADHEGNPGEGDWRVRWCRSMLVMLARAETLLGKVRRCLENAGSVVCPTALRPVSAPRQ